MALASVQGQWYIMKSNSSQKAGSNAILALEKRRCTEYMTQQKLQAVVSCIPALSQNASMRQVAMLTMHSSQHFTDMTGDSMVERQHKLKKVSSEAQSKH